MRVVPAFNELEDSKSRFSLSLEAMLDEQLAFERCVEADLRWFGRANSSSTGCGIGLNILAVVRGEVTDVFRGRRRRRCELSVRRWFPEMFVKDRCAAAAGDVPGDTSA